MVQIKKSFTHKNFVGNKVKKISLAKELGAVIENKVCNYSKTGQWRHQRPLVGQNCIGCALCVGYCPEAIIQIKDFKGKRRAQVDLEYCKGCGICASVCPVKAIEMQLEK